MMTGFMFIGAGNLSETLRTCDKCRKVVEGSVFCGAAPQQPAGVDEAMVERAAAAIANERIMRRGSPSISNVLDILPPKLLTEVQEDARAALTAALAAQQQGGAK